MTDTANAGTAKPGTFRLASVFRKSFVIFGRHFVPIVVIVGVGRFIPYYFTQALTQELVDLRFNAPLDPTLDAVTFGWLMTGARVLGSLVSLATAALAAAMVTYGAMQELTGGRFSAGRSFTAVLHRPLPVMGVGLCTGIAVILGYLLLIVPGVIVACMWYVSLPACIAERTGVFQSLSRSRLLTRGYRWRVLGAVVLVVLVPMVVAAARLNAMLRLEATDFAGMPITQLAILSVSSAFGAVLSAVVYCELRAVRENKISTVFD